MRIPFTISMEVLKNRYFSESETAQKLDLSPYELTCLRRTLILKFDRNRIPLFSPFYLERRVRYTRRDINLLEEFKKIIFLPNGVFNDNPLLEQAANGELDIGQLNNKCRRELESR